MKRLSAFFIATAFFAMALFMVDRPSMAATTFKDVPDNHPHALAIAYIKDQGFVEGYPDGTFRPNATINRAEFMKIVVYAAVGQEPLEHAGQCFTDVATGEWFYTYICYAERLGYVQGYPDGSFKPTQNISFVEAAKIISNILGEEQEDDDDIWYLPYVNFLAAGNAIPLEIEAFDVEITRAEMAEMIFRLHANITDKSSHSYDSLAGTETNWLGPQPSSVADIFAENVSIVQDGDRYIVSSDGLPSHETGEFPTTADTNGDGRPDNPNSIEEQNLEYTIPLNPTIANTPGELPMGPIAIAVNGVALYNPYTAEGTDAVENEVFDLCDGHPDQQGRYHYHQTPGCLLTDSDYDHRSIVGLSFDGYLIYGPQTNYLYQEELDECNGHEHDGLPYHYHVTETFPYIMGCYRGEVDNANFPGPGGQTQENADPTAGPPQAAIDACSGKNTGSSCSFTDGGRTVSGSCRSTPNGMACAP